MTAKAQQERRNASAHNRLLSVIQEETLAGLVFYRSIRGLDTTTLKIQAAGRELFGVSLSDSWLSTWKRRYHLSHQKVHRMSKAEHDDHAFEVGINFIKEIRGLHLKPEQLYAVDKKMIKDTPHYPMQIGPIGMYVNVLC